jgi:outer membrane lipoprotein-sorting protein
MKVFVLLSILSCCTGSTRLVGQAAPTPAIASPEQSSCSLFNPLPKQTNANDSAVLLAAYNSQVHLIRSLHVAALVRGKSGKEYGIGDQSRELPAIIDLLKPNLLRMTGALSPTSSRGFEMTSDGIEFRLLVPEEGKKTFLVGPVDAPPHSQHPRENLRPQPLIDALSWEEAALRATAKSGPGRGTGTQTLEVDLPPDRSGPITGRIDFDLRGGVVDSLSTYDSSGRLVSELTYRDWRMMSVYPDGTPTGCFPRRIHLVRRDGDYEIELHITEIALNPQIPMSKFRSSPPRGIPIVHVDLLGNSAKP